MSEPIQEPAREYPYNSVPLPQGVKRIDDARLKEILSGYEEFPAADLFEIRSLAYEVRNWRMCATQASDAEMFALHAGISALDGRGDIAAPMALALRLLARRLNGDGL